MHCKYLIDGVQCKLHTKSPTGYCHLHKRKQNYRFERPERCPVCFNSLHQCLEPLSCGHWVHKTCIRKSGKAQCPLCREPLNEFVQNIELSSGSDSDFEQIEIPQHTIVTAALSYLLYQALPSTQQVELQYFLSVAIQDTVPVEHPYHWQIVALLYIEALSIIRNG